MAKSALELVVKEAQALFWKKARKIGKESRAMCETEYLREKLAEAFSEAIYTAFPRGNPQLVAEVIEAIGQADFSHLPHRIILEDNQFSDGQALLHTTALWVVGQVAWQTDSLLAALVRPPYGYELKPEDKDA